MTSPNVELVREISEAWESGDYSSAHWAHPAIVFVRADGPSPGTWNGLPGLIEATRDWVSAWEDARMQADEYRELDDERVLVLGHYVGRGRTSGLELGQISSKGASLFHVRDGRVTRIVHYLKLDRALADLGLDLEVDSPAT